MKKLIAVLLCSLLLPATIITAQASCATSRLTPYQSGRVTPGLPNRMRVEPTTTSDLVDEIPVAGVFEVLETGTCAEGYLWVRVVYNGKIGWTAEAQAGNYFVEPVAPPTGAIVLSAYIWDVSWSADGHTLALATNSGIYLVDKDAPEADPVLFVSEGVNEVEFSPTNPEILATSSAYGMLRVWNTAEKTVLYEEILGDPDSLSMDFNATGSLKFTTDGDQLFAVTMFNLATYNTTTWDTTNLLSDYMVYETAMSPDGQQIAVLPQILPSAYVTDWSDNQTTLDRRGITDTILVMEFSSDSSMVAVGDNKGHVQRWILGTGERYTYSYPFTGEYYFMQALAFSPDSKLLAVGEGRNEGVLRLLDAETMRELGTFRPRDLHEVKSIAFSPNGSQIAVIFDNLLMIIDTAQVQ